MNTVTTPIDASRAREKFFTILERVFSHNETFLIRKGGIPMAEIISPRKVVKKDLMHFAGIWKEIDAGKMIGAIYTDREDRGREKRKLPPIE